jgi:phosphoglycolate phosphatase
MELGWIPPKIFAARSGRFWFPCKPAPDVLLRSMDALGARPEECLFAGDSAADMEAGRRAGAGICAVRYGYGNPEHLARWAPDYWISDLRELI